MQITIDRKSAWIVFLSALVFLSSIISSIILGVDKLNNYQIQHKQVAIPKTYGNRATRISTHKNHHIISGLPKPPIGELIGIEEMLDGEIKIEIKITLDGETKTCWMLEEEYAERFLMVPKWLLWPEKYHAPQLKIDNFVSSPTGEKEE